MAARLRIPVPEMIFGDNQVAVAHEPSGWAISFAAEPALDLVDKTDRNMLRVAYAADWSRSRERTSAGIKEVVRPFDWSYSTTYRGSESGPRGGAPAGWTEPRLGGVAPPRLTPDGARPIPIELLRRRDPILFNDEVVLYESELDDNGISMLSVKFRVMEHRMLLLCRLYMRLDDVVVRCARHEGLRGLSDGGGDPRVYGARRQFREREEGKSTAGSGGQVPPSVSSSAREFRGTSVWGETIVADFSNRVY